ncbi:emerin-like isoform X2 [Boleophthalmus pectinirostris]|uniref:emerin-like isoform X2 n=1 Tax=Boleophthalmus pectinirostris TaxID=150288 RepID=UPI0024324805|nr:emerin-like isoform X2 [Boleophthalmus pectinirostris]
MANLSERTADELRELLDEYGIKHGPIVDSTRSLYEKKLREAMAKAKKPSSDKTYYREEEEEVVTYVTRTPVRAGPAGDSGAYMRSRPEWTEREYQNEASYSSYSRSTPDYRGRDYADDALLSDFRPYTYSTPTSYKSSHLKSPSLNYGDPKSSVASPAPKSSGFVPPWFQVIFFLVVLIFLYIVFSSMESNENIKGIE